MELTDKVALITGGTKGIGAASAIDLAKRGADIAINGRNNDAEAAGVKHAIEALGQKCELILADVSIPEEATQCVAKTVEKMGRADILVHSAGGLVAGSLFEVSAEDWMKGFDTHVHAIFHLTRAIVPHMRKGTEGAIITIASAAGKLGCPTHLAYQTVKGALPQMTRALARELAADNIRVNCVAPGVIRTRFHDEMPNEVYRNNLANRIPLAREGTSEQVASLITELVTNDYISGDTVTIDGGLTSRIA
jgi:NAD(P)-dependent dehydrogenase (short-subunit alcohol dehydrogenase family)